MAEVKMSQAQLPNANRFPSITPPKQNGGRQNRSQKSGEGESEEINQNVPGRPSTPTAARQTMGVELPKLIHLDPHLLDSDSKKPQMFGQEVNEPEEQDITDIVPPMPSPLPSPRIKAQSQRQSKMQPLPGIGATMDDEQHYYDQLPYQGSYFKSSTVMRMYTIQRRHPDMFGGKDSLFYPKKKGVILHTDRYHWEDRVRPVEKPGLEKSQRDRLEAEMEHIERVKGMKRRLDSALPHRMEHDLLMGGKKVEFTERVDINGELARLRAMVLPTDAKDLYLGKGIGTRLPKFHQINKPRGPPVAEPPVALSAPAMLEHHGNRALQHMRQLPGPNLSPQQSIDRNSFKRECTCIPLPTLPKAAKIKRRKRKSVDDSNIKYGETARKPSLPKFERIKPPAKPEEDSPKPEVEQLLEESDTDIIGAASLASSRPNPTLSVNNIKFVSPGQSEVQPANEARPSWTREEEDAESDMEIDLPAEPGVSPAPQDKLGVSPRAGVSTSPLKAVTPNPLKFADPRIGEEEREMLLDTFKRLDTDEDGHILYQQIKTQLPESVSSAQERFIKQVYDITSASTYFGVEEFYSMSALIKRFHKLSPTAKEAFEKVNMMKIKDRIIHYVELYQTVDRSGKGSISIESLEEIICQAMEKNQETDKAFLKEMFEVIIPDENDSISKLDFILHIPYFRSLEKPDTGSSTKSNT